MFWEIFALHISIEKNPDNAVSRRHICYLVSDLQAFQKYLQAYGVEIILDQQPIPGRDSEALLPRADRFFLRDR